jgi:hypothetical protein
MRLHVARTENIGCQDYFPFIQSTRIMTNGQSFTLPYNPSIFFVMSDISELILLASLSLNDDDPNLRSPL